MSNNDNKSKSNINIEIDEKIAEGTYSNLAIINHSVSEFVLDFICIMPGTPKNKVKSRIIITPQHAKRLSKALNDNIVRFEKKHGEIKENQQPPNVQLNFGQTGEAYVLKFRCVVKFYTWIFFNSHIQRKHRVC